ncbi:hypothetical protein ScPMuIL_009712 [Solemya velum]
MRKYNNTHNNDSIDEKVDVSFLKLGEVYTYDISNQEQSHPEDNMAGLVKAKKYDWKDSNMALFGSDLERQVKKESAMTEPAWEGAGQAVGLQVWRIVKFEVTHWPKEDYGMFFDGDSYIILNTFKEGNSETFHHDVHFWIGKYSSQDEYGTAAYKTVELDTFLDDVPIQHREVQGHESSLFKSYFDTVTYMKGGASTGFRHVAPETYKPRLFHFCGSRRQVQVTEVPAKRSKINSGDVYILDLGMTLYQWNGSSSSKDERYKAAQYLQKLKSERSGERAEVLEENRLGPEHQFYAMLSDDVPDDDDDDDEVDDPDAKTQLFRLSDAAGQLTFNMIKEGPVGKSDFDPKDVFILDTTKELFVWVGMGASVDERKNSMTYAHKYLMNSKHPLSAVVVLNESQVSKQFEAVISAAA